MISVMFSIERFFMYQLWFNPLRV